LLKDVTRAPENLNGSAKAACASGSESGANVPKPPTNYGLPVTLNKLSDASANAAWQSQYIAVRLLDPGTPKELTIIESARAARQVSRPAAIDSNGLTNFLSVIY